MPHPPHPAGLLLSRVPGGSHINAEGRKLTSERQEGRSATQEQTAARRCAVIYKRGKYYWYKFVFAGELIRESTKQGNDKIARNMESDHRARLAREQKEREAACERLQCSEVLRCHECEKLFNAEKTVRKGGNAFCGAKCATTWEKNQTMPTLRS